MTFGLTSLGFVIKRLQDIKDEMVAKYQSDLGPAINLDPLTPQGQVIANLSAQIADLWEELEAVYNSAFPDTASGTSLDDVAGITGDTRLPEQKSLVVVTVTGTPGTVVPILSAHVAGDTTSSFTSMVTATIGVGGTVDVTFQADTAGPVAAPAGTLTELDTVTPGIDSITNAADATVGRLAETDAELRLRRAEELQRSGTATIEGIRNALMEDVADVSQALVIENPSDSDDTDNRPPHCFEAVVVGGLDQDVADMIFKCKPAGIATFGTSTLAVKDSMGFDHMINFSRPVEVPIYVTAVLTKNADTNEPPIYPAGGDDMVKQAIVDFFDALTIGKDVIDSALYTPVNTVEGILGIVIKIGLAPAPAGTANIAIPYNSIAVTDLAKVVIA